MAVFVLVHGAWSGAHGWRSVRRLLTTAGHLVSTPSLTGLVNECTSSAFRAKIDHARCSSVRNGLSHRQTAGTTIPKKPRGRRLAASLTRCAASPSRFGSVKPIEEYAVGLTYIKATADSRDAPGGNAFWDMVEHAHASNRWRYHEIATNHMVARNRPRELAAVRAAISSPAS